MTEAQKTRYIYELPPGQSMPPGAKDGMEEEIAVNDRLPSDFDPNVEDWPLSYIYDTPPLD